MKKILLISLLFIAAQVTYAQKANWKEMHDFHEVMSTTFHPSEENNLKPLRDSAVLLAAKATAWKKSTVPSEYNKKVTKPILKKLVTECEAIKKAVVAKRPDEELKAMIAQAHDTFHEIMEKCRK